MRKLVLPKPSIKKEKTTQMTFMHPAGGTFSYDAKTNQVIAKYQGHTFKSPLTTHVLESLRRLRVPSVIMKGVIVPIEY